MALDLRPLCHSAWPRLLSCDPRGPPRPEPEACAGLGRLVLPDGPEQPECKPAPPGRFAGEETEKEKHAGVHPGSPETPGPQAGA